MGLALAALWAALVTFFGQANVWFGAQLAALTGAEQPWWSAPAGTLAAVGIAALPLGMLSFTTRDTPRLVALRTLLLACLVAATFAPARAIPSTWTQPAAVAQALIALALAALVWLRLPRTRRATTPATQPAPSALAAALLAAALGVAAALPWLRLGALGSALDTGLALLAGLSFGLLMGLLLDRALFLPLGGGASWWSAGLVAGVALLIAGGGFGMGGSQILLMLSLPPLGLAAAGLALRRREEGVWPLALLLGLAAAAPLALVDPGEISLLLLIPPDLPLTAMQAALTALALGLVLGGSMLLPAPSVGRAAPLAGAGALALAVVLAAVAYSGGQPGLHGDRLFVILRQQADLATLPGGPATGREERIDAAYRRLVEHADTTQAELRGELERRGVSYTPYYLMNAIEVDSNDPWLRAALAARPEVDRVLDSPLLRPLPEPAVPGPADEPAPDGPAWNIEQIGADRVWDELGITGEGIVIGQSDSGVDAAHPALREGYRGRDGEHDYSWIDPWSASPEPYDRSGHGTHTLGSAVGRGGIGVAPGAEWIGCVVLERNLGSPARYLDCLQFMLAPYPQGGDPLRDGEPGLAPHVLNNSWGCPPEEGCDPEALQSAVAALRAAGLFVVTAAGNEGAACSTVASPISIYDEVTSVGAVDRRGEVTSFSSRGPVTSDGSGRAKPDIVAPGAGVRSSWPGGSYSTADGTSSASPHVAGVVALMWSANPALVGDVERTERILAETARPPSDAGVACGAPGNLYGAGVVDAYAAVQAAQAAP
jgi:subtilisin family serine protease